MKNEKFPLPTPERKEERSNLEAHLEDLLSHYHRINEGEEGVIGLVDLNEYDQETLEEFFGREVLEEIGQDKRLAIKMLKMFPDGQQAVREGAMQKKARDILLEAGIENVEVPRIYYSNEFEITSPELRAQIEGEGVAISNNKAGLLLMDYIPGEDLLTSLMKEVVKRHPELEGLEESLDGISYESLASRVAVVLGQEPIPTHGDAYAYLKKKKENDRLLVNYLSHTDYILEPEIVDRAAAALKALHKAGLYHRDLHERNLMTSRDENGKLDQVYLIDFSRAILEEEVTDEVYADADTRYLDDDSIVARYKILTEPREQQERTKFFETLSRTADRVKEQMETAKADPKSPRRPKFKAYEMGMEDYSRAIERFEEQVEKIRALDQLEPEDEPAKRTHELHREQEVENLRDRWDDIEESIHKCAYMVFGTDPGVAERAIFELALYKEVADKSALYRGSVIIQLSNMAKEAERMKDLPRYNLIVQFRKYLKEDAEKEDQAAAVESEVIGEN